MVSEETRRGKGVIAAFDTLKTILNIDDYAFSRLLPFSLLMIKCSNA